jgi:hypothetical protein
MLDEFRHDDERGGERREDEEKDAATIGIEQALGDQRRDGENVSGPCRRYRGG